MRILSLILLLISTICCYAQEAEEGNVDMDTVYIPRNSVYVEVGGNAVVYSLNYERLLVRGRTVQLALRFGGGYLEKTILTPLMMNILIGRKKHKLEIDLGATGLWNLDFKRRKQYNALITKGEALPSPYPAFLKVLPTATLGYRYQSDSGLYYKAGFTLLYQIINYKLPLAPWGSIGIGYFFRYKNYKTQLPD